MPSWVWLLKRFWFQMAHKYWQKSMQKKRWTGLTWRCFAFQLNMQVIFGLNPFLEEIRLFQNVKLTNKREGQNICRANSCFGEFTPKLKISPQNSRNCPRNRTIIPLICLFAAGCVTLFQQRSGHPVWYLVFQRRNLEQVCFKIDRLFQSIV